MSTNSIYAPIKRNTSGYYLGADKEFYAPGIWIVKLHDTVDNIYLTDVRLYLPVSELESPWLQVRGSDDPIFLTGSFMDRYQLATTRIKKLFIIPTIEHFTCADGVDKRNSYRYPGKDSNGKGFVYYTDEIVLDPTSINFARISQHSLMGEDPDETWICGDDTMQEEDAIRQITTLVGCGGDIGATVYDPSRPITVKQCGNMHADGRGGIICGRPAWENNMVHGEHSDGCIIRGYVPPLDCPYRTEEE